MTEHTLEEKQAILDSDLEKLNTMLDELKCEDPRDARNLLASVTRYVVTELFFRDKLIRNEEYQEVFADLQSEWNRDFSERLLKFNCRHNGPLSAVLDLINMSIDSLGDGYDDWYAKHLEEGEDDVDDDG